jgi:hypothetical protein
MKDIIMRILFVLGIIIILVMLAIGIVKIVPKIFSGLASAGNSLSGITNKEEIIISTNTDELTSDEPFVLSWEHENKKEKSVGLYSVSHNCVNDVSVEIIGSSDSKTLLCNTPFTIGPDPVSIQLNPMLNKENTLRDVDFSIKYIESNTTVAKASGKKTLTLRNFEGADTLAGSKTDYQDINGSGTVEITTTDFRDEEDTSTVNYLPTTPVSTSPADLSVSNISLNNNIMTFIVSNIGGRDSGIWSFNYTLPTNPVVTRNSGLNISLRPGERLQLSINLNGISTNGGNAIINVNSDRAAVESTYSNNIASIYIDRINGGSSTGNSNGAADLAITDMYVNDDRVDIDDEVVLYFTVENLGGEDTGRWEYEIDLPIVGDNLYSSRETSLRPGQSRTFRIEFDGLREGNNQDIDLELDPDDDIDEENERNNRESIEIDVRD